ncbi:MAG TPA: anhydro-N-acetylmuramic acid kinase [Burkholderiales bacterium]|jgi:anhydro-N-acetylmuramic acid kinase|nr:anhydro-N-acetylmuramic acid kinase [Burkholderiales bacterium]
MAGKELFIGLMSGTSLDGVDAVLMDFSGNANRVIGDGFIPYDERLRAQLLALHQPYAGELHDAVVLGNQLARLYAQAVDELLRKTKIVRKDIVAIGCHGQTIRHRPDAGYTIQLGNGALLAELSSITVVCDFRGRDIAAGGEGAPLVPVFHAAVFSHPSVHRVVVNIGGIANLSDLPPSGDVRGFDTGPGNALMDAWIRRHLGKPFDKDGAWAQSGRPDDKLLNTLLTHDFFSRKPPKSTGRETFHLPWVEQYLTGRERPADVQATLLALTATSIARGVRSYCGGTREVYLCGGGAQNGALIAVLKAMLPGVLIARTDELGVGADWVEACAFAWLAHQALQRRPGNLPAVTGARGPRILGAIYPN